jgi:hypothetical protein
VGKISRFAQSFANGTDGEVTTAGDPQNDPPAMRYASDRQPISVAVDYPIVHVCPKPFQQVSRPELPFERGWMTLTLHALIEPSRLRSRITPNLVWCPGVP